MKALPPAAPAVPTVKGAEGVHFITPSKTARKDSKKTTIKTKFTKRASTDLTKQLADLDDGLQETVKKKRSSVPEILKCMGESGKVGSTARSWSKARTMAVVGDQPKTSRLGRVA